MELSEAEATAIAALAAESTYASELSRRLKSTMDHRAPGTATVYRLVNRLTLYGLLEPYWEADSQHPGGRRRFFRVTPEGRNEAERAKAEITESRITPDLAVNEPDISLSLRELAILRALVEEATYLSDLAERLKLMPLGGVGSSTGALYRLVRGMEGRGLIASAWEPDDARPHQGARRRYYWATPDGHSAYEAGRANLLDILKPIESFKPVDEIGSR